MPCPAPVSMVALKLERSFGSFRETGDEWLPKPRDDMLRSLSRRLVPDCNSSGRAKGDYEKTRE